PPGRGGAGGRATPGGDAGKRAGRPPGPVPRPVARRTRCLHDGGMPTAGRPAEARGAMSGDSARRWAEMFASLAALLPPACRLLLVDGPAEQAPLFAARLADELAARGGGIQVTASPDAGGD